MMTSSVLTTTTLPAFAFENTRNAGKHGIDKSEYALELECDPRTLLSGAKEKRKSPKFPKIIG
jgi:hypothetical protein